jgi:ketosteroid isomerase-like protein
MRMSKIESGLRAVLAFNQACNQHDLDSMMKLLSNECIFESANPAPSGGFYAGKDAIRQYWKAFFQKNPQVKFKIEDAYGFGDQCIKRWRLVTGDADRIETYVRGTDIIKVNDSLILEILSYTKGTLTRT